MSLLGIAAAEKKVNDMPKHMKKIREVHLGGVGFEVLNLDSIRGSGALCGVRLGTGEGVDPPLRVTPKLETRSIRRCFPAAVRMTW